MYINEFKNVVPGDLLIDPRMESRGGFLVLENHPDKTQRTFGSDFKSHDVVVLNIKTQEKEVWNSFNNTVRFWDLIVVAKGSP